MTIFHCLFRIRGNMIMSLLYDAGKLNILKFKGKKAVPLTDTFWDEWKEYAGMCSGDTVDFCLIYDEKPVVDVALMSAQCESKNCIWSRNKINEALNFLEIREPTKIYSENGIFLLKIGNFMNVKEKDIISMKAWYAKAEKDSVQAENIPLKTTALIQHYKGELQLYKESYEK